MPRTTGSVLAQGGGLNRHLAARRWVSQPTAWCALPSTLLMTKRRRPNADGAAMPTALFKRRTGGGACCNGLGQTPFPA